MVTTVRFRPTGWVPVSPTVQSLTGTAAGLSSDSGVVTVTAPPTISITNGATASVADGSTLQLAVSTAGSPAPTVAYSSSDEMVATVSASGLVTAVAEGTATITATATNSEGSVQDTIDVTVQAGGGVLYSTSFSEYTNGASTSGTGNPNWTWGENRYCQVTNGFGRSDSHSMRFEFFGPGATGNEFSELRFAYAGTTEIWLEFYLYFPDGSGADASFQRSNSPNIGSKFFALWSQDYQTVNSPDHALLVQGHYPAPFGGGANGDISMAGVGCTIQGEFHYGWLGDNADPALSANGPMYRGQWNRVRVHFRCADWGATNDIYELWLNNTLVIQTAGLGMGGIAEAGNYLDAGYFWGAQDQEYAADTYVYMDDVTLYAADPGW